jgi:hypothetical protein
MPDINNILKYSGKILAIIKLKKALIGNGFSYTNWGDDDLAELRKDVRDFFRIEQKGICAYCKKDVSTQSPANCHVEHIVPKSKHIEFIFEIKNLCVICADCNVIKREQETLNTIPDTITLINGNQRKFYPKTSAGFKIIHPHFDDYEKHILMVNGWYIDRTDKGAFTIGACRLNRKLREFGWEEIIYSKEDLSILMNKFMSTDNVIEQFEILKKFKNIALKITQG